MRWMTLCLFLAAFLGCGTVCDATVNAQQDANKKGEPCEVTPIHVYDASACNSNLGKCSPDDVSQIQLYNQCLENLAVCTKDTVASWDGAIIGCQLQPLGKISAACGAGFK